MRYHSFTFKTQVMKRFIYLLPLIFILSCKKENDNEPPNEKVLVSVKDYKSNQPLSNMAITLYCCTNNDLVFGCIGSSACGSVSTDADGKAFLSKTSLSEAEQGISITGTGYWEHYAYRLLDSVIYMDRVGNVEVTLHPTQTYPTDARLELAFISERGKTAYAFDNAAVPTGIFTQTLKAFGGQINSIKWRIYSFSQTGDIAKGSLFGLDVPLTGSVSVPIYL